MAKKKAAAPVRETPDGIEELSEKLDALTKLVEEANRKIAALDGKVSGIQSTVQTINHYTSRIR